MADSRACSSAIVREGRTVTGGGAAISGAGMGGSGARVGARRVVRGFRAYCPPSGRGCASSTEKGWVPASTLASGSATVDVNASISMGIVKTCHLNNTGRIPQTARSGGDNQSLSRSEGPDTGCFPGKEISRSGIFHIEPIDRSVGDGQRAASAAHDDPLQHVGEQCLFFVREGSKNSVLLTAGHVPDGLRLTMPLGGQHETAPLLPDQPPLTQQAQHRSHGGLRPISARSTTDLGVRTGC